MQFLGGLDGRECLLIDRKTDCEPKLLDPSGVAAESKLAVNIDRHAAGSLLLLLYGGDPVHRLVNHPRLVVGVRLRYVLLFLRRRFAHRWQADFIPDEILNLLGYVAVLQQELNGVLTALADARFAEAEP